MNLAGGRTVQCVQIALSINPSLSLRSFHAATLSCSTLGACPFVRIVVYLIPPALADVGGHGADNGLGTGVWAADSIPTPDISERSYN
jgi:hypothetical protein